MDSTHLDSEGNYNVASDRDQPVYSFHYNGDYSGDVTIVRGVGRHSLELEVPFVVLKEFVGQAMMSKHISEVEDLDGKEFLEWVQGRGSR